MRADQMDEEESRKRIDFYMHSEDVDVIEAMKRRYGCSTSAAIRACIRIAAQVKLNLDRPLPT